MSRRLTARVALFAQASNLVERAEARPLRWWLIASEMRFSSGRQKNRTEA